MRNSRHFPCLVLAGIMWATTAVADEPLVEIEIEETSAIPGQFLTLRVSVLVPTWLPKPAVFPPLEAPNILVRLPEGATGPISRKIEGETWSGVTRRYLISPMVPGRFDIAAQDIVVTWADPGQADPLQKSVPVGPFTIEGAVPEGAEELDPFVAAQDLSLTREVSDVPEIMKPGDSVTLTVTAQIEGTPAMFLPPLLPPVSLDGIASYPAEPAIIDSESRGNLSGVRRESITLVAESGGGGTFPAVSLQWYNLGTGKVETAMVDGFDLSVDAPAGQALRVDPRRVAIYAVAALALALAVVLAVRRIVPRSRRAAATRRARRAATERHAYGLVKKALAAKDFDLMVRRLDIWAARCPSDPRRLEPLYSALCALGAARYSTQNAPEDAAWGRIKAALPATRSKAIDTQGAARALPPLNPETAPYRASA